MEKNELAIVIITYNVERLLSKQVECIKRFCKDHFDVWVFDNSTNDQKAEGIYHFATECGVEYVEVNSAESSGSRSNAFACNMAYFKLQKLYAYFLYLDHDTFPIRDFSVAKILEGRLIGGVGQTKSKMYFQQTSLMWDNEGIDHELLDFSTNQEYGLDTGGNLYKIIDKYTKGACLFFNEKYYQNPYFREGFYNFYATINDDMFMHFINASDWNPTPRNEERLNALLNVLNERING